MMEKIITATEELSTNLGGELIQPQDENYDETRKIYNGMIELISIPK